MQWNNKSCPYMKTVLRQVQNLEQSQELRLPEEMPDIGRVLCAWGQSMIRSKQWRNDSMSVSGGVSATVMYLPEDSSFPRTMEVWIPFLVKWNLPQTQREGAMRVQCLLKSLDARTLSARKMMARASISILGEALEPTEVQIYSPGELPEGVEVLTNTYPAMLPREAGEKVFSFEDDVPVPNVKKWVSWRLNPQITDQSVVGNRAVVRGNGQLEYVYMDEEGALHSGQYSVPFAQFLDLDREYDRDASVDVMLDISNLEADGTEEGAHVQCSVTAQYVVWDRMLLEVAEDAYCPMGSVEVSTENLLLPMELDNREESVDIQSQFRDGKVVDVTFLPEQPTQFREGETVCVSLNGSFQILYEDMEGNLQATVENWSEEMNLPAAPDTQFNATIRETDVQDSGMRARIKLGLQTRANQEITMITGLTVGERMQPDDGRPTLILRRMDADSLWELAKNSGSTMDAIRKANGLTQEPERGQMLLIPIS